MSNSVEIVETVDSVNLVEKIKPLHISISGDTALRLKNLKLMEGISYTYLVRQLLDNLDENYELKEEIKMLNKEFRDIAKESACGSNRKTRNHKLRGPPAPPKKIDKIKQDLKEELNSIFNGDIPKPSKIKKIIEKNAELSE